MNDYKIIDCQRRNTAQQNHGLTQDFDYEFDAISSLRQQRPENNMGTWVQQQQQQQGIDHDQQSLSQLQCLVNQATNNKPSSTIISRFETPTLAFYATERCMGFHHNFNANNSNNNNNNSSSSLSTQFSTSSNSPENYTINDSSEQQMFRPNNTNPLFLSPVNSIINTPPVTRLFPLNLKENNNQDIRGYSGTFGSSISQLSFESSHPNLERQSPRFVSGNGVSISSTTSNSALVSNSPAISSKTRIRWTQDLHEKFLACVNRLGGAEMNCLSWIYYIEATPKAILRLMESKGLTIFHVKSHLQKYRIAKYLPDSSEGKYEKRTCIDVTPQLEATTGLQIKEALQLQLDVQRRLHEQLEIQRNLQLQIEEQGKQLKMMFDMQQRTSNSLFRSQSSDISSPHDEPSNTIDDIQVSLAAEASGNSQFPSKIS